jgi:hypothetical protein
MTTKGNSMTTLAGLAAEALRQREQLLQALIATDRRHPLIAGLPALDATSLLDASTVEDAPNLRTEVAEVVRCEYEDSLTDAGTVAFPEHLGSRVAAELMLLVERVRAEGRTEAAAALRTFAYKHHRPGDGYAQRVDYGTGVEYSRACTCGADWGENERYDGCAGRLEILAEAERIEGKQA